MFINPDRDMGVKAIENLMKKKGKFDYVLLETTGLADPGPIASVFWMDEQLCSDLYLDGMGTLSVYSSRKYSFRHAHDLYIAHENIASVMRTFRIYLIKI